MDRSTSWLQTDEAEDVAGSIRHCIASLQLAASDEQAFKWVLLSLHSALQGACVCHLATTFPPIGVATRANEAEWLKWAEDSRATPDLPQPKTYVAKLPELLKRIRRPHSAGDRSNATGIGLSDTDLQWWTRIHGAIRNQFTHFAPRSWSIELSGISGLVFLTTRLISEMCDASWAFRHQDESWMLALRSDLGKLNQSARLLDEQL